MPETSASLFKDNLRMLAEAVGEEDLAENPTVSVTRFLDGPTRLYQKATFSGVVLDDAGLARPKSQDVDDFALEISEENIEAADADKVFVTVYEDDAGLAAGTKAAFERNPLWKPIAPKVTEVSDTTWMTAVSLQGAWFILEDLAKAFGVDAPERAMT